MNFLNTFDKDTQYPIFKSFCSYLTGGSIVALSKTCKQFSTLYQEILQKDWDIDKDLRRFVDNPFKLRTLLGKHDALISGSFAVQFFERVVFDDADLNIYMREATGSNVIARYLVRIEGYTIKTYNGSPNIADNTSSNKRINFARENGDGKHLRKVQLILTNRPPIQAIWGTCWSTAVMNVIAWNKAYSICPLSTFIHHKGYMIWQHPLKLEDKYEKRGWNIDRTLPPIKENSPFQVYRRVRDRYTWMIPIDVDNIEAPMSPDDALQNMAFFYA